MGIAVDVSLLESVSRNSYNATAGYCDIDFCALWTPLTLQRQKRYSLLPVCTQVSGLTASDPDARSLFQQ